MNATVKRLSVLAALGAVGIVTPVTGASAAATPLPAATLALTIPKLPLTGQLPLAGLPAFTPPAFTAPAFTPPPMNFVGPSVGQVAAVIGPTVITTAPSTFNNTNIQTTAGGAGSGGQAGP
jgi:hypothetical protein